MTIGISDEEHKPAGPELLRNVLSSMLLDCSEALKIGASKDLPDAIAARDLQDELPEILRSANAGPEVQFAAYLLDLMISDAFKNFFGDLISSKETDDARRRVCLLMSTFFEDLSRAVSNASASDQIEACREYATKYLDIIRTLNDSWIDRQGGSQ